MVGTILPIGYGEREKGKVPLGPWLYAGATIASGTVLGAVAGAVASSLPWHHTHTLVPLWATGLVALLYATSELELLPVPRPQMRRQVPAKWRLHLPPRVTATLYGLELGTGVTTFITVATFYVALLWSTLFGSVQTGALVMGAFGLGRALPVILLSTHLRPAEQTYRIVEPLTGWESIVHLANGLVLGVVGTGLVIAAMAL
jgi:cytochrome c biogenesis protein CcdA